MKIRASGNGADAAPFKTGLRLDWQTLSKQSWIPVFPLTFLDLAIFQSWTCDLITALDPVLKIAAALLMFSNI